MRIAKWIGLVLVGTFVLVFALIGALHTFRGTPVHMVRTVGDGQPATLDDSIFRETIELLIGTPLGPGNEVQLLLNGDETFPQLWRDIHSARESVTIRLYYILPGEVAESLRAALLDRARAGVSVYFLYDEFGSDFREGYLESLRAAGVRVAGYRPMRWHSLNRAQNRSHVRAVVIDGRVGFTGGFGIDDKWRGNGRRPDEWRETNVRFMGPAVAQLQAAFVVGWAEATGALLTGRLFFPPAVTEPAGHRVAGVLYTSPTTGSTEAERFLALSTAGARRSLFITNSYFVPDDDLRRLLIRASRTGADVRVLTAGKHTDVPLARLAGRRRYEELLRAGIRIYEYQPSMIHAKTVVVDGIWATVGTMNFDNRSAALNEESNLVLYDAEIGARLNAIFLEDLRFAREIRLEEFRDRSWFERLKELGAATLTRVL